MLQGGLRGGGWGGGGGNLECGVDAAPGALLLEQHRAAYWCGRGGEAGVWSWCCTRSIAVGATSLPTDAAEGGSWSVELMLHPEHCCWSNIAAYWCGRGGKLECGVDAAPGALLLEQHRCLLMRQRGEAGVWSWCCCQSISVRATRLPNDSAGVKAGLWLVM